MPCLGTSLVANVLGLAMSSDGTSWAAAIAAPSSSSAPSVGSSTTRQLSAAQGQPQQQRQQRQASSSTSALNSNVWLESLTPLDSVTPLYSLMPLSCGLIDLLGVTKETMLHAAKITQSAGLATVDQLLSLTYLPLCTPAPSELGVLL
jgi:hypothetical protein